MKYQINYLEANVVRQYRANQWRDFASDVEEIELHHAQDQVQFSLDGKSVSFAEALAAANNAWAVFIEKRASTKKQIWVRKQGTFGNTRNNFEQIWVKK